MVPETDFVSMQSIGSRAVIKSGAVWMKIGAKYSHLNGFEWLMFHWPDYWAELQSAIAEVDAEACKTKVSAEKTMLGRVLYSPTELNKTFECALGKRGWGRPKRVDYFVTDTAELNREALKLGLEEQKALIESHGKTPHKTHNTADFGKGRVSVEVQFGKYSFVQFDLFIKHAADYIHDRIDLGIEIVPMKTLEAEMSSGPPYFEKHLHEIVRQGRIFPPVPLILIGVEP